MAWPSSPSWDILNSQIYGAYRQLLAYNAELFNQKSGGGLQLSSGPAIVGDYEKMSFLSKLSGLVIDRDITSDASIAKVDFSMDNISRVKYAKGTPEVRLDDHRWQWIGMNPEKAVAQIALDLAEQTLVDNLNTAIGCLIAANTNVGATLTYDGTGGTATFAGLTNAAQLWGDRSQQLRCWVMHSKVATDLNLLALANSAVLFRFGDIVISADQFGRPFIVTDTPALVYTSTGTKYHVLGLAPGAVQIEAGNDFLSSVVTKNGTANIARTFQAQWTNNISLKGFGWNTSVVEPTTAQLGTGTNWVKKVSSVKDCGAILANFQ